MIICWCSDCIFPCGKKFITSEEYRRFTKERYESKYPECKVLSSTDYDRPQENNKAQ